MARGQAGKRYVELTHIAGRISYLNINSYNCSFVLFGLKEESLCSC